MYYTVLLCLLFITVVPYSNNEWMTNINEWILILTHEEKFPI